MGVTRRTRVKTQVESPGGTCANSTADCEDHSLLKGQGIACDDYDEVLCKIVSGTGKSLVAPFSGRAGHSSTFQLNLSNFVT